MVSEAFTSTYMATKKERKKRTPQDSVSSSLVESSVSGPTCDKREHKPPALPLQNNRNTKRRK